MNLKKLTPALFIFAVSMATPSWGNEEKRSIEAREKLIEQCIRQMAERGGDVAGRAMSFQTLQKLGADAKSSVPALTRALGHEDSYISIQAAYTLWKVDRQAEAIPLLAKALSDTGIKPRERALVASLLGEIGPPAKAVLPALKEATKAQEAAIRVNAAWALWAVDQQSDFAKPILIDALKNDDLNVFSSAAWALGGVGFDEPGLTALGEAIRKGGQGGSKAYAAKRALPGLANALKSKDGTIRREAVSVMSLLTRTLSASGSRDLEGRAAIIALSQTKKDDGDPAIREAAAEVLKKIDPKVVAQAGTRTADTKSPAADSSDPEAVAKVEAVAKAFVTALANKNVDEAAQYIIPEERDEIGQALKDGMPPLPKDPKVRIKLKDNGTQAYVILLNSPKSVEGLNMKLSEGKWWIVK
ncbi:MAG: hypothetical protein P1U90_10405 [Akkermansiaceae bacterium]|nr:hypothetical protein [Akkermansiaceae bacterium]